MDQIVTTSQQLPDTLEDLTKFVLVGKTKLTAYMAKLKTVNRLAAAQEIRNQTLEEAQDIATALIAAEQRIGELLLSIPKATAYNNPSGKADTQNPTVGNLGPIKTKTETISEMGYDRHEAADYQTMAKNPEIVQRVIADAMERGEVVTKTQVLREIQKEKEIQKKLEESLQQSREEVETLKASTPEVVERVVEKVVEVKPNDYDTIKETYQRVEKDYRRLWEQSKAKDEEIKTLKGQLGRDKLLKEADTDVRNFTHATYSYIRQYGGHVWAFEQFDNLSEPIKEEFVKAIKALDGFAQQLINNLGGGVSE